MSRRYFAEGHESEDSESNVASDGTHAPFYVFDIESQVYLPGLVYSTRAAAERVASTLERLKAELVEPTS